MSSLPTLRPATVIAATAGVAVAGFVAYAAYFDHRRRTDPDFRRALRRESKREARVAQSRAKEASSAQRAAVKRAVETAKAEGFPEDVERKEAFFMDMVSQGEVLGQQGGDEVEAALCFYKALKVYPQPSDLIGIYDKTVSKPILDILADMIAHDPSIAVRNYTPKSGSDGGSSHGIDD